MNDDGLTGAELLGYSTGMFIHLAPYVLGGVLIWFIIAYFANTSIINSATGSEPLSRMENKRVEQVAERKKQSHYQAGKQAKQEQGPEIVPALLGLYTDVLHP